MPKTNFQVGFFFFFVRYEDAKENLTFWFSVRRNREHVQLRVSHLPGPGTIPFDVLLLVYFWWSRCQRWSGEEEKGFVGACQRNHLFLCMWRKRDSLERKEPMGGNTSKDFSHPHYDWLGLDRHHHLQRFSIWLRDGQLWSLRNIGRHLWLLCQRD